MLLSHTRHFLLTVLLILIFPYAVSGIELDTTSPQYEFDSNFCNYNPCGFEKERILPDFEFNDSELDLKKQRVIFYSLNVLDSLTTWRAVNRGYGRERNPLMPDYPNAGEVLLHKLIILSLYRYYRIDEDPLTLKYTNYGITAVVINNAMVIKRNE